MALALLEVDDHLLLVGVELGHDAVAPAASVVDVRALAEREVAFEGVHLLPQRAGFTGQPRLLHETLQVHVVREVGVVHEREHFAQPLGPLARFDRGFRRLQRGLGVTLFEQRLRKRHAELARQRALVVTRELAGHLQQVIVLFRVQAGVLAPSGFNLGVVAVRKRRPDAGVIGFDCHPGPPRPLSMRTAPCRGRETAFSQAGGPL